MLPFRYRPDVDGLRAVAVCAVLLFHADLGLSGGYVGVDVFFVISGFLITGLIVKHLDADDFTMRKFWVRRIRRILPAACLTATATLAAGLLLLLPVDLVSLAQSTFAQQLLLANVFFWRNTGYFDGPAELQPLLHMWSLAVEEQFYLGFPLVLVILKRRVGWRASPIWLSGLALLSFAVGQVTLAIDRKAAFYLLPGRIWELLVGAILVFLPQPTRWPSWTLECTGALGLTAVVGSAAMFDSDTNFPGTAALLPTFGAALVIYANTVRDGVVYKLLALRPIVLVGLVSYSLYLLHWPMLAYLRYWLGERLPLWTRLSVLASSGVLAYVSWRYIETPFRRGFPNLTPRRVALSAFGAVACISGGALAVNAAGGLPERLPSHVRSLLSTAEMARVPPAGLEQLRADALPILGIKNGQRPDFLLWGDSHARAVAGLVDQLAAKHRLSGVLAAEPATIPLLGVWRPTRGKRAVTWNDAVLEYIRRRHIANVILVSRWAVNTEGRLSGSTDTMIVDSDSASLNRQVARTTFRAALERTLSKLRKFGVRVWIAKQPPVQTRNPQLEVVRAVVTGRHLAPGVSLATHQSRTGFVNAAIDDAARTFGGIAVIDLAVPCFGGGGASVLGNTQGVFYKDTHHLSEFGAKNLLAPEFDHVLANVRRWRDSPQSKETWNAAPRPIIN